MFDGAASAPDGSIMMDRRVFLVVSTLDGAANTLAVLFAVIIFHFLIDARDGLFLIAVIIIIIIIPFLLFSLLVVWFRPNNGCCCVRHVRHWSDIAAL